jgi:hypothetical protein
MSALFSVGEYVARRFDGKVGKVMRMERYDDQWLYYVQFDVRDKTEDNPDGTWAGTEQAWRRRDTLHAHADRRSRDCDGDYSAGNVYEMTLEERCDAFGDLRFKERVMGSVVSLHGYGTLTVKPEGMDWDEQTEEGFVAVAVEWCEDECSDTRSWQRDHRAEAMGY